MPNDSRVPLWLWPASVLLLVAATGERTGAHERQPIDKPIQFVTEGIIKGSESLLKPGATVLVGEIHGTWETPLVVATLMRRALTKSELGILCLELPVSEQASLDRFLNSDGGDQAIADLLKPPFWACQRGDVRNAGTLPPPTSRGQTDSRIGD